MAKSQNIIEACICLFFGVYGTHRFYGKDYGNGLIYFLSGGCLLVGFLSDFILTIIDFDFTHLLRKNDNLKKEESVAKYKKLSLIGKIVGLVGFWIGLVTVLLVLTKMRKGSFPSSVLLGVGIFFLIGLVINGILLALRQFLIKDEEQNFELLSDVSGPAIESTIKKRYIVTGVIIALLIISGVLFLILRPKTTSYVQEGYEETINYGGVLEKKYGLKGNFTTTSEVFNLPSEITSTYNLSSIKVWYPEELLKSNGKYPLIVISNGSDLKYSLYEPVFQRLATWGFIVVGTDDIHTAKGLSNDYALTYVLDLNKNETNKLYNKIDLEKIGMKGFSEGSSGAINAVTNYESGKYYKAIVVTSAIANEQKRKYLGFEFDLTKLNIPFMNVGGMRENELDITPLEDMIINFNTVKKGLPKVMARRKEADHTDMCTFGDGYVTAFFMYFLKGDTEALGVFKDIDGVPAEMGNNNNWSDFQSANMPN